VGGLPEPVFHKLKKRVKAHRLSRMLRLECAIMSSMHRVAPSLVAIALCAALESSAGGAVRATVEMGPVDAITVSGLRDHLRFIASDALEGRDALSPGFRTAADYVATTLQRLGARPAGDRDTFLQHLAIRRTTIDGAHATVTLGDTRFEYGRDYLAPVAGSASGRLVYVGHGWTIPSRQVDPYAGLDVRDRLVVVLGSRPPQALRGELAGLKRGTDYFQPEDNARRLGARGIVRLATATELGSWSATRDQETTRGDLAVERLPPPPTSSLPTIVVGSRMAAALFTGEHVDASQLSAGSTADATTSFRLRDTAVLDVDVPSRVGLEDTTNVVAIVEGSDPVLKNEYVALGAHLDHIGRLSTAGDGHPPADTINNGADDDGSGVVALLEMVRAALSGPPPRRSLLFVWHTGEEYGSWGARYFTAFPPVPLDRIIAQLNVDMIGRSKAPNDTLVADALLTGPKAVYLVGSRRLSRDLGDICAAVNEHYLRLTFNYRYDAPSDPERIYERSDHYAYAQKGIPTAFYFSGLHADYHQPSDEVGKIDFDKLQRVARTVLATAWTLADAPDRPRLDTVIQSH
jgi:hypothetical protein